MLSITAAGKCRAVSYVMMVSVVSDRSADSTTSPSGGVALSAFSSQMVHDMPHDSFICLDLAQSDRKLLAKLYLPPLR